MPLVLSDYSPGTLSLQSQIADHEELDLLLRSSQRVLKPQASVSQHPLLKQAADPEEEILTFDKQKEGGGTELERLREENKRLKRTLVERFDQTFSTSNHQ